MKHTKYSLYPEMLHNQCEVQHELPAPMWLFEHQDPSFITQYNVSSNQRFEMIQFLFLPSALKELSEEKFSKSAILMTINNTLSAC
jgi:hypothetical protein